MPAVQILYMIHHDLDLCYDIYNIVTECNGRQAQYLSSMFLTLFDKDAVQKVIL